MVSVMIQEYFEELSL